MTSFRAVMIVGLGLLAIGGATAPHGESARDSLLRTDREWAAVSGEGRDVERIVSFWSDDATVIPEGAPAIHGKAALRAFVEQSLAIPGFHISWKSDDASVSADGTLGYMTGTNAMTVPGADGKLVTMTGRAVSVWRRAPRGEWKCVVDTWNAGP